MLSRANVMCAAASPELSAHPFIASPLCASDPWRLAASGVYTRTLDEHAMLVLHPSHLRLVRASPCSGRGFKFASAFEEVVADLALTGTGQTNLDVSPDRYLP
jgi:hypothetical protein